MAFKKEISEKENLRLVLDGKIPQWLPSFSTACAMAGHKTLGRKADSVTGLDIDIYGVKFTKTIDGPIPLNTQTQDFELKDIAKWREIIPKIDLNSIDWEQEAKAIRAGVKEDQMINFNAGFVWEQLHYMMGFEEALFSLASEPEETAKCLNAMMDFTIDSMRRLCKYLKPEIIMIMEHIANAQGLLMSPKAYREIIKPVHKRFYDAVYELGAFPEMHVDGRVEDVLQDYADIGIKMLQPFQVFNDIEAAKTKYGFIACGGWNAVGPGNQPDSTEEDARQSVRLAMDSYGPTGRYIFWESGATPRFPKILEWIKDERETYGFNFYHKGD
jgi:hypothetical protein